uniref:Uncharacterized protein n=1 Tax=Rhizophora mucronata TaxID=61149 RepID=A0A2P2NTP2_RHIMU
MSLGQVILFMMVDIEPFTFDPLLRLQSIVHRKAFYTQHCLSGEGFFCCTKTPLFPYSSK